jgi:molecular chaperone GrpE (heat shock protein)
MIRDLVRLHDEVTRLAEAGHAEARADLDLVATRLLDTLARWGLSPFSPEPGDQLDTTRHQGVGRVPSSDGEPGTVATVRRIGFAHDDGRTFRAAEVEVFVAPPPPPAETEET